jgi:hypothetical protein
LLFLFLKAGHTTDARISVAFLSVDFLSPFFFKSLMRMLAVDDRMDRDTTSRSERPLRHLLQRTSV